MKNPDLISRLVRDLEPVKAPRPAGLVAVTTLFMGALALFLIALFLGPREDLSGRLGSPGFALEVAALALTGTLATLAVIRLRLPGGSIPLWNRRALTLAVVALATGFGLALAEHPAEQHLWSLDTWGWKCALTSSLLTLMAMGAGLVGLRRGATTRPALSAGLLVLATLCFGWIGITLDCPSDHALHVAIWHLLLPLSVGLGLSLVLGRRLLRW